MKLIPTSTALIVSACLHVAASGAGSSDVGRSYFQAGVAPGQGLCVQCHRDPPTATRFVRARFDPAFLTSAFQRISRMNPNLERLGTVGINDVATYLGLVGQGREDATDADRVIDWGEDTYATLLAPSRQPTGQALGYTYRFYPTTGVYVGIKDGSVFFLDSRDPTGTILNLGTVRSYLDLMPNGR